MDFAVGSPPSTLGCSGVKPASLRRYALLCIAFPLSLKGKERILVAGWIPGVLLSPVQGLVTMPLTVAIQYLKAVTMMVSLLAAVAILVEGPKTDTAPDGDVSQ